MRPGNDAAVNLFLFRFPEYGFLGNINLPPEGWSSDEMDRWNQSKKPEWKEQFYLSRHFIRHVLAEYLQTSAKEIDIRTGKNGKPYLSGQEVLEVNWSHSGNWFVMAVNPFGAIGVDIEQPKNRRPLAQLAKRFFSLEESSEFNEVSAGDQPMAFFRSWTLKEAFVKYLGETMAKHMNDLKVLSGGRKFDLNRPFDGQLFHGYWQQETLHLGLCLGGKIVSPEVSWSAFSCSIDGEDLKWTPFELPPCPLRKLR